METRYLKYTKMKNSINKNTFINLKYLVFSLTLYLPKISVDLSAWAKPIRTFLNEANTPWQIPPVPEHTSTSPHNHWRRTRSQIGAAAQIIIQGAFHTTSQTSIRRGWRRRSTDRGVVSRHSVSPCPLHHPFRLIGNFSRLLSSDVRWVKGGPSTRTTISAVGSAEERLLCCWLQESP